MSKILILSGSPRKGGNTDILCESFANGACDAGHNVETIRVADKRIGFCRSCHACLNGKCIQKDDSAELNTKLSAADVIVLATPVYFYSMSAQLKAALDRTVAVYPQITEKRFYFLTVMADETAEHAQSTLQALRGFMECCEDSTECAAIVGAGFYEVGSIRGSKACKEAYLAGKNVGVTP